MEKTTSLATKGSPPPMRGKAIALCSSPRGHRITPAYAGKSRQLCPDCLSSQDHPRLCGEKALLKTLELNDVGSPPPMRGKAENLCAWVQSIWITPAYAGKSDRSHSVMI